MADDLFQQIQQFLPKYLTPEEREDLFEELKKFPENRGFYLPEDAVDEELLQGDGWQGLVAINFDTLEKRGVSGLILSNSCDIDVRNFRKTPVRVLFAPLIPIERYRDLLVSAGRSEEQIDGHLRDIRRQRITSMFFLPQKQHGPSESVVLLDNVHAHPLQDFLDCDRSRLFRLNQFGFYLLLIKLSIHLSRFQEGISRYA